MEVAEVEDLTAWQSSGKIAEIRREAGRSVGFVVLTAPACSTSCIDGRVDQEAEYPLASQGYGQLRGSPGTQRPSLVHGVTVTQAHGLRRAVNRTSYSGVGGGRRAALTRPAKTVLLWRWSR